MASISCPPLKLIYREIPRDSLTTTVPSWEKVTGKPIIPSVQKSEGCSPPIILEGTFPSSNYQLTVAVQV